MSWRTLPHLHIYEKLSVWSTGEVYESCRCGKKRRVPVGHTTVQNVKISMDNVGAIVAEAQTIDKEES